jgi:hypothetical protein
MPKRIEKPHSPNQILVSRAASGLLLRIRSAAINAAVPALIAVSITIRIIRRRAAQSMIQYFLALGGITNTSTGSNSNFGSSASGAKYAFFVRVAPDAFVRGCARSAQ